VGGVKPDRNLNKAKTRHTAPAAAAAAAPDGFMRRREKSKEDILRAVEELFRQFGIEKVSINDIARKAGVSQATIYNNFGSKDGLAREFMKEMIDRLISQTRLILTTDKPFREKLRSFLQFMSEIISQENPPLSHGVVFPANVDLLNDPQMKQIHNSVQEKMTDLFLELLREGKKQGQVIPDLSEEAFRIYFSSIMAAFTDAQLHYRFHAHPKLALDLLSLATYGISGKDSSRP
jgi:AcrR family transcriptional regulator